MTNTDKFDVLVLGSGPGGYVAAERAAQLGMNTAVIERDNLGGVCLNWGCIPTKALMESAHAWKLLHEAKQYGLACSDPSMDFPAVIARSRAIADRMSKGVGFLMKSRNVTVIQGTGKLALKSDRKPCLDVTSESGTRRIDAEHIILATGGRPMALPGTPFDGDKILNSTHAMSLNTLPKSLIVIGAGAIGMEFASFYRTMGTDVTIIEMLPQVLPLEDAEIIHELNRNLRRQKMTVMTGTRVTGVDTSGAGVTVTAEGPKGLATLEAEKLLVAIGVRPNSEDLGCEDAGIEMNRGFIKTDDFGRTNVRGVYAVGDVSGPPLLAHKASAEALVCIDAIAGLRPTPINPDHIPGCTYCIPQVASVGLNEKTARERGIDIKTGSFPFRANGRSIAMGETDGIVKLIFDTAAREKLVGAHIMHAMASELIAELGIVLTMGGNAEDIARTIHAHPTLSEAVMEAAEDALGRAVHK